MGQRVLFNKQDIYDFVEQQKSRLKKKYESLSDEEALDRVHIERLKAEFRLQVPSLRPQEWNAEEQSTEIVIFVPFDGDPAVFDLAPSAQNGTVATGEIIGHELLLRVGRAYELSVAEYAKREISNVEWRLHHLRGSTEYLNQQLDIAAAECRAARQRSIDNRLKQSQRFDIPRRNPVKPVTTQPVRESEPKNPQAPTLTDPTADKWDVFMSHASDDKNYVRPLVDELTKAGVKVWYDEHSISWGDPLRPSINNGLLNSSYAIVVLSQAFLAVRKWTEHELNGLFAREKVGKFLILPIWHGIGHSDLLRYDPALADRFAKASANENHAAIVRSVLKMLGRTDQRPSAGAAAASSPALAQNKDVNEFASRIKDGFDEGFREKALLTVSGSRFELTGTQLTFSISPEEYLVSVPADLSDRLFDAAPRFEKRAAVTTRHIERMIADAQSLIPDVRERLEVAARITAETLIRKAEVGDAVFNAPLFNVLRMPTGADKDENATVVVELYRTDYFTLSTLLTAFRGVMASSASALDLQSSEVRHALRLFRTGFGLNCPVCVVPRTSRDGAQPEPMLIFGRRSARAGKTSSTGTWHVTANEALTQKDVVDQQISLHNFVVRALDEEVGIRPEHIGRTYVFNVFIYLADMQPGMNALVFCEVDDLEEIFIRISGSMDGTVEYDSHVGIPFRDEAIQRALRDRGWPDAKTGEIVPFSATADSLLRSVSKRGVLSFSQGF